jgi:hypothetical protein
MFFENSDVRSRFGSDGSVIFFPANFAYVVEPSAEANSTVKDAGSIAMRPKSNSTCKSARRSRPFAGVDTAIILKKADRYRTIQSCERYGTDWPEVVLNFDHVERSLSLGVERSDAEAGRIGEAIASFLATCDERQTRVQIETHVEGTTTHKRTALKTLCSTGRALESGAGAKCDPLRYELASTTESAGNKSNESANTCSHVYAGTGEQQSKNGAESSRNIADILVPGVSDHSEAEADSREQGFLEGKL